MQSGMNTLQNDVIGLQKVAIADYDVDRRSFKTWLFGTDKVFANSWQDETDQVRERLQQIRQQRKV
jgi:hypothetical protein